MKYILSLFLFTFLIALNVKSQSPQGMNYQAIARDQLGTAIVSTHISIRFTIKNGQNGSTLYVEHDTTSTNAFGLFTLSIGNGTADSGVFAAIPWGTVVPWLKVEMISNGGTIYANMGTSQLLSVPYALYSLNSGDTSAWRKSNTGIYYNKGNAGIGTTIADPSAKLDVSSQQQGFLLPRMSTTQRDSIAIRCACIPAEGLMIFNTTTSCFEAFVSGAWYSVSCPAGSLQDTVFIIPGIYTWTVPAGITSVSVVCVGGGAGSGYGGPGGNGGNSSFGSACYGYGGSSDSLATGGSFLGDGGGNGGNGARIGGGGGGAGGYTGNGGNGVAGSGADAGYAGTGGGGGGGSQCFGGGCGGGGGVGLYGVGNNGAGGCACCTIGSVQYNNNGYGGSFFNATGTDGQSGGWGSFAIGGFPGGGAAGGNSGGGGGLGYKNNITVTPGQQITVVVGAPGAAGTECNCGEEPGAGGAVRIIWGGGKSFPNNAR